MGPSPERTPEPAPSVWVLSGHKAGDNAQLMALAGALGWPLEVKRLVYRRTELATNLILRVTLAGMVKSRSSPLGPPWPDLVLTAGRRNEPVARWIKRQSGGRTKLVHLGRPWAPPERFELVITTPQYFVPERANVLTVGLPLHAVTPEALAEAASAWQPRLQHLPRPRIALLVGGVSSPYRFAAEQGAELGRLANERALQMGGSLMATTSARTDPDAAAAVARALTAPHVFHRWRSGAADNPYRAFLALADEIIVTGDSISMLAEATATGKPVFIFDLGGMRESGPRPLRMAKDSRSLLHLILMRVAPRRMRRDVRILLQLAVASGRSGWLGGPMPAGGATSTDDLAQAAAAVRGLFR
jgi:mitochondrial fission protein ELM1